MASKPSNGRKKSLSFSIAKIMETVEHKETSTIAPTAKWPYPLLPFGFNLSMPLCSPSMLWVHQMMQQPSSSEAIRKLHSAAYLQQQNGSGNIHPAFTSSIPQYPTKRRADGSNKIRHPPSAGSPPLVDKPSKRKTGRDEQQPRQTIAETVRYSKVRFHQVVCVLLSLFINTLLLITYLCSIDG